MQRVLVTGGTGTLGQAVVATLSKDMAGRPWPAAAHCAGAPTWARGCRAAGGRVDFGRTAPGADYLGRVAG